jgi:RNA polymerase sigma-70 factor (ECF subfamily)
MVTIIYSTIEYNIEKWNQVILNTKAMKKDSEDELGSKALKDCALIRDALELNDQKAYTALLKNHKDFIYALMYKIVENHHDAEDLTMEAFSKAFRYLHRYSNKYAFSTWLFKIAFNNCMDFLSKKKLDFVEIDKEYTLDEDGIVFFEISDDKPNPEESLFNKEQSLKLKKIVETLKPNYRRLVELRYYEELSYDEIGIILDMPLGSVKGMLSRAKNMLQEIAKEQKCLRDDFSFNH